MEFYDNISLAPTDDGKLLLSKQGWVTVDESIWDLKGRLKILVLSYNSIETLSPLIYQLKMLCELDLACNMLTTLPPEIGLCKKLKIIRINGNQITHLPDDISECRALEELYASENKIKELPDTIGDLKAIKVLKLQNNELTTVTPFLGKCTTLEDADLRYNKNLDNIPQGILGDTKLIIWMCQHNLKHYEAEEELREINKEMENLAQMSTKANLSVQEELKKLTLQNKKLISERPETYMKFRAGVKAVNSVLCTIQ